MLELTVSQVSGIIAAAIYVVQFIIPTATTLILVALLSDDNNLMTWTQLSRALHSSQWPLLVRGDFSVAGAVGLPVKIEGILRPIVMVIVGIAAIVTPLGLYDAVIPSSSAVPHPFKYQRDTSSFGYGTPERSSLELTRQCGATEPLVCPGSNTVVETGTYKNGSEYWNLPNGYNLTLPSNITEVFQSGLEDMDPTVSSVLDIEWRSFGFKKDERWANGTTFVTGKYRQLDTMVLDEGFQVVEGLIIDHENGGIGFRSHSVPAAPKYGAKWSEDLLFITPHSECVNNNLTIDIEFGDDKADPERIMLTDRGGFINLNTTLPKYDPLSQENIDLGGRARLSAYLHNSFLAAFMNVTNMKTEDLEPWSYKNSSMDKMFPIELQDNPDPQLLTTRPHWNVYSLYKMLSNSTGSSDDNESQARYPNSFNVTSSEFETIGSLCETNGTIPGHKNGDISAIGIFCSVVMGAAQRSDEQHSRSLVFEPGSKWSIPLYSCAAAAKASIKTADFKFNGTDSLDSLSITDVREKDYKLESDKPLWGVEKLPYHLTAALPLWGLVSDRYKDKDDLSVLRKESLWLPGYSMLTPIFGGYGTSIPGISFHMDAFGLLFDIGDDDPAMSGIGDYSGKTSMAMFKKWQDLSTDSKGISRILSTIWTDIAANAVMGTRGWVSRSDRSSQRKRDDVNGKSDSEEEQSVDVPVIIYNHRVRYHIAYGIPAFIVLVITFLIGVATLFYVLIGKATPSTMRKYLFHTAVGRIIGTYAYPDQTDRQALSREWNAAAGQKRVSLASPVPTPLDPLMMGQNINISTISMDNDPLLNGGGGGVKIPRINVEPLPKERPQSSSTHHLHQDDSLYNATPNQSTTSFSPLGPSDR